MNQTQVPGKSIQYLQYEMTSWGSLRNALYTVTVYKADYLQHIILVFSPGPTLFLTGCAAVEKFAIDALTKHWSQTVWENDRRAGSTCDHLSGAKKSQ